MAQEARSAQSGDERLGSGIGVVMVDLAKPAVADEGIEVFSKRPMFLSKEGPVEMLSRRAAACAGGMCVHV
jgi:hypothetical protein